MPGGILEQTEVVTGPRHAVWSPHETTLLVDVDFILIKEMSAKLTKSGGELVVVGLLLWLFIVMVLWFVHDEDTCMGPYLCLKHHFTQSKALPLFHMHIAAVEKSVQSVRAVQLLVSTFKTGSLSLSLSMQAASLHPATEAQRQYP